MNTNVSAVRTSSTPIAIFILCCPNALARKRLLRASCLYRSWKVFAVLGLACSRITLFTFSVLIELPPLSASHPYQVGRSCCCSDSDSARIPISAGGVAKIEGCGIAVTKTSVHVLYCYAYSRLPPVVT